MYRQLWLKGEERGRMMGSAHTSESKAVMRQQRAQAVAVQIRIIDGMGTEGEVFAQKWSCFFILAICTLFPEAKFALILDR